jgi:hypothetical protein
MPIFLLSLDLRGWRQLAASVTCRWDGQAIYARSR